MTPKLNQIYVRLQELQNKETPLLEERRARLVFKENLYTNLFLLSLIVSFGTASYLAIALFQSLPLVNALPALAVLAVSGFILFRLDKRLVKELSIIKEQEENIKQELAELYNRENLSLIFSHLHKDENIYGSTVLQTQLEETYKVAKDKNGSVEKKSIALLRLFDLAHKKSDYEKDYILRQEILALKNS